MDATERYLDLLKGCLTRTLDGFGEDYVPVLPHRGSWKHWAFEPVRRYLDRRDMQVIRRLPFNPTARAEGREWPAGGDTHWRHEELAVGVDEVKRNFARYGLLDERVRFLKGWFADTLPDAPIRQLAVLRLDGDLYGSNYDALEALCPKVSPGGYVIIDDYGNIPQCRQAIDDYRAAHGITAPLQRIDWAGVWWQVGGAPRVLDLEEAATEDARA